MLGRNLERLQRNQTQTGAKTNNSWVLQNAAKLKGLQLENVLFSSVLPIFFFQQAVIILFVFTTNVGFCLTRRAYIFHTIVLYITTMLSGKQIKIVGQAIISFVSISKCVTFFNPQSQCVVVQRNIVTLEDAPFHLDFRLCFLLSLLYLFPSLAVRDAAKNQKKI